MAPSSTVTRLQDQAWTTAASALAVSVALIGLAYALATPAEQALLWSNEVIVTAHGSPVSQRDATASVQSGAPQPRSAGGAGQRVDFVVAPRECAPDDGVTEQCVFN